MQRRFVDGADNLSADLTSAAVAVLVVHQEIGQVTVPQIPMKSVITRQIDQIMDALVKQCCHILRIVIFILVMGHQKCHIIQQFPVLKITIYDQFFFSHMVSLLILYFLILMSLHSPPDITAGRLRSLLNNCPGSSCCGLLPEVPAVRSSLRCPQGSPQNQ